MKSKQFSPVPSIFFSPNKARRWGGFIMLRRHFSLGQGEINFPLTRCNNIYQEEGNYFPLDTCWYRRVWEWGAKCILKDLWGVFFAAIHFGPRIPSHNRVRLIPHSSIWRQLNTMNSITQLNLVGAGQFYISIRLNTRQITPSIPLIARRIISRVTLKRVQSPFKYFN